MKPYTLHGYWRSSCSWRVRIALHIKGIEFEHVSVHLVADGGHQHTEEYKRLNPMRQVPTLYDNTHNRALTQSLVILDYLDHMHPSPALYPSDPLSAMAVRAACETINSGIQPLQNLGVLQQLEISFGADQAAKSAWASHFIGRGFEALERSLDTTAGTYCFGDTVSAADVCLVPQIFGALRFGVDMAKFPVLTRINDACKQLEAFQRADAAAQPDAQ